MPGTPIYDFSTEYWKHTLLATPRENPRHRVPMNRENRGFFGFNKSLSMPTNWASDDFGMVTLKAFVTKTPNIVDLEYFEHSYLPRLGGS